MDDENDCRRRDKSHHGIDLMDLSLEHFQELSSTPGISTSRECATATAEAFQFGMDLSHSVNDGFTSGCTSVRRKQRQNSLSSEDLQRHLGSTARASRRQSHSETHSQSFSQIFSNWLSSPTSQDKTINLMDHSAPDEIYLHNSKKKTPRRKTRTTIDSPDLYHIPSPPFLRRSNSNESTKTSTSTILRLRRQYHVQQDQSKEKQPPAIETLQATLDEKDKVIELLRQQLAQQKQGPNNHQNTPLVKDLWNSLRNMTHHNTPVTSEDPYIPANWQQTPKDYQDKIDRLQAKLDTALANQQAAERQLRERDLLVQTMQKQAQQHHDFIDGLQKTHQDIVHETHVEWHTRLTKQATVFQKRFDKAVALIEEKHAQELQDMRRQLTKQHEQEQQQQQQQQLEKKTNLVSPTIAGTLQRSDKTQPPSLHSPNRVQRRNSV